MTQDKEKTRVLVTGATGIVGSRIADYLHGKDYTVYGASHKNVPESSDYPVTPLNLGDAKAAFELVNDARPDVVVHCAANSNIDICELYQEQAWVSNVVAVKNIIGLSLLFGFRLIFFSSEQIYGENTDGMKALFDEESELFPLSFYAKTKKFAEEDINQHLEDYVILRLALVYGWGTPFHHSWVDNIFEDIEDGIKTRMYKDQKRSMIYVEDIPPLIESVVKTQEKSGIYNLGGPEPVLRNQFGEKLAKTWGFDDNLIEPVSMNSSPAEGPRPMNCAMDITRANKDFNYAPRTIEEALKDMKENNPHS